MGFATIPILGLLLTLIGIYKRKENYGKIFLVIGSLLLLMTSYVIYQFKSEQSSRIECGYWNEIGIKKECSCSGEIVSSESSTGGKIFCEGKCSQNCVCYAPYKTDDSFIDWEGIREVNCDEMEEKIFEGYYGEKVIFDATPTPQKL